MKTTLMTVLILLAIYTSNAQTKEEKLKDIRKKYGIIETSITKKKIKKQYFEYRCPEGNEYGTVWFIFNKKELQKIEINTIINEENSQKTMYYFWKGKLFFAFHESVAPQMVDETEMIYHYTEKRVYFFNEKPFYCLEKTFSNNTKDENPVKSENVANTEVECTDIDFMLEHLKTIQEYKDIKSEITLCIW